MMITARRNPVGRSRRRGLVASAAIALGMVFSFQAQAVPVLIDFESDIAGSKGPSFQSVDSPLLTFSDTNLEVNDFGPQSIGQGLATFGGNLGLNMNFATTVDSLAMAFGNDDPAFVEDRAILTVFLGNTQVGQTVLIYNKNDIADEVISISGVGLFDRAHLVYTDSNGNAVSFLAEVVDNVRFNTAVPAPATAALLSLGLLAFGMARRKRA